MEKIHDILKSFSVDEIAKLKILLPLFNEPQQKEVITLRVLIDEYSNFIKQNRSKSYHVSVMSAFKHLVEFFGTQKSIREIELKETENFCSYLQQKVHKGFYVYYRTLKAAFNKALEWGYVKENYFLKIKLPKKQKLTPVFINCAQLSVISSHIKNPTVKEFIIFAFYTGMRLDEIINLRWKNIDFDSRVITVGDENFTTKGRMQRFIPICEEAMEALLRMKNSECRVKNENQKDIEKIRPINLMRDASTSLGITNGFVFCKANGEKYTGDHISQSFKRACKTAGLDNSIHFHSLRHSFASNLVQKGVPLYTIKELLGHSSISTTEIYSHLNMETLREAVRKLDGTPSRLSDGQACVLPLSKGEKSVVKIFKINSAEKG